MKNPLITIGESIHASIPAIGKLMKQLAELGRNGGTGFQPVKTKHGQDGRATEPLDYIKALIESQADDGADYIAVNLDAFGEDDPQVAVDMMVEYVRLVRKWGRGVPICIDSSNNDVLIVGLKEWYDSAESKSKIENLHRTPHGGKSKIPKPPLINSVKIYTADKILPLKKKYDFDFVGLLVSENKPIGPGGSHSVDELYNLAKQIFDIAVGKYKFKPEQIFFDSTVFPLAIDMPMEPNVPGYTYRTFQTIKKIKSDPKMKGVHFSLGISNCARDLPGRKVGICRAYLAKAMEYGLDAAIVNVAHHYGQVEPTAELLELVDAYAKMDGSAQSLNRAMELMGKFCRESRESA
jgi:cobalamin-dependent methionine synthase I